jgi:hypothetical protein
MGFFGVIKKIILWSYERGSWQWDILCVVILGFIFLTPNWVFDERQQRLSSERPSYERTYIRAADLATAKVNSNLHDLLTGVLSEKYNHKVSVKRFEVDSDPDGNIRGYRVWFNQEQRSTDSF